jgi:hypothetical protein
MEVSGQLQLETNLVSGHSAIPSKGFIVMLITSLSVSHNKASELDTKQHNTWRIFRQTKCPYALLFTRFWTRLLLRSSGFMHRRTIQMWTQSRIDSGCKKISRSPEVLVFQNKTLKRTLLPDIQLLGIKNHRILTFSRHAVLPRRTRHSSSG